MVLRGRKETLLNLVRGHGWQRATEAVRKLLEEVGVGQKTVTKQWYTMYARKNDDSLGVSLRIRGHTDPLRFCGFDGF